MKKLITSCLIFFVAITMSMGQNPLVISEIMYNPPESNDDTLEYFEIANLTNSPYSLAGHIITAGVVDTFGSTDIVPANGFFVCVKKVSAFNSVFNGNARQWRSGSLNNSGEALTITSPDGAVVASVVFGDSGAGWPAGADGNGYSMELCDLTKDPNLASSWGASKSATGITVNGFEIFGSPGSANTADCGVEVDPNTVIVTDFQFEPNELTILEGETVTWKFEEGHHNVNGNQSTFPSNPASFRSGDAAEAPYEYSFTFNVVGDYDYQCDPHAALMKGKVHVLPKTPVVSYPVRTIGEMNNVDAAGVADSLGKKCEVSGIVYGVNMRATGLSSTIIDGSRDGIGIFNANKNFGYSVTEKDLVTIRGTVDQFNGLTQIVVDTIWVTSTNNTLHSARTVTALDESTESDLVKFTGMTLVDPSQWKKGTTFNATITNGTTQIDLRVVNTTTLAAQDAPTGTFEVTGIGGQFDNSNPFDEGYQLLPRRTEDVSVFASTIKNDISEKIEIFPNPVSSDLFVSSTLNIQKIEVINAQGQVIKSQSAQLSRVNTSSLNPGAYWMKVTTKEGSGVKNFIKL